MPFFRISCIKVRVGIANICSSEIHQAVILLVQSFIYSSHRLVSMPHGFSKVHLSAYIIRNKNTVMVQQCKFRSALHEQLPNNCNKNGDPATNSACFSMFIIFQLFFNIFQLFFNVFQAIFRTSRALPASRRILASNMVCNSGSCSSDFTLSWQVDQDAKIITMVIWSVGHFTSSQS